MIFNLGLSFIPYIITSFSLVHKNSLIIAILALLIGTIFYPNALYMFTDFIHIKTREYYIFNRQVQYIMDYVVWVKLCVDVLMITLSLILSYETFVNFLKILRCYNHIFPSTVILLIYSALTGIAIYIGRFMRFNSWDILNIRDITTNILTNSTQNDYYLIALFSIMHFVLILLFKNFRDR